jgi:hypothetical protein
MRSFQEKEKGVVTTPTHWILITAERRALFAVPFPPETHLKSVDSQA